MYQRLNFKMRGSGKVCSVLNCKNNQKKIYEWKRTLCRLHTGILHEDCPCLIPFGMHVFPKDQQELARWIIALGKKDFVPSKFSRVCSIHFEDNRPTLANPTPTKYLPNIQTKENVRIGIIGGSGLDDPDVLQNKSEKTVTTPFGKPSDVLIEGSISGVPCVLLARHGRKHNIMPSSVNYRANIWALRDAGCTHIIVTTACGSLKEDKHPGDLVFIDQFIDRTTKRSSTFYDGSPDSPKGICHMPMHTPFCPETRKILMDVAEELGHPIHKSGTMITIEGPRFSSKAESRMFRAWGGDLINMTTVPEVVLAKEAGLCYAAIALTTDYDCWHETEEAVSVIKVLECMKSNSNKATEVIKKAIPLIAAKDWSECFKRNKEEVNQSVML